MFPQPSTGNPCSMDGCGRPFYAKGYCEGHYYRMRRGARMDKPFEHRRGVGAPCVNCGDAVKYGRGGWSMCDPCYRVRRRTIIRAACIEMMGGECARCCGRFPICVFDFHHNDESKKEHDISELVNSGRVGPLAKELIKCTILCANCHRTIHNEVNRFSSSNMILLREAEAALDTVKEAGL